MRRHKERFIFIIGEGLREYRPLRLAEKTQIESPCTVGTRSTRVPDSSSRRSHLKGTQEKPHAERAGLQDRGVYAACHETTAELRIRYSSSFVPDVAAQSG